MRYPDDGPEDVEKYVRESPLIEGNPWYATLREDRITGDGPTVELQRDDIPANITETASGYEWSCWAQWPGTYDDPPEWDVVASGIAETLELAKIEVESWWQDVLATDRAMTEAMENAARAADDGYPLA